MSSSSRSIAAARQKRAGEQSQPMNTSRPVTSISSQGAFAQQQYQQQMMSQSIPVGSKNVRVAQNRTQTQGGRETNQNIQQQQQQAQSTRISLSNAIGLITLRLGKLENSLNEAIEDGSFNNNGDNNECDNSSLPPNMKLVSDEVFENIVNRLNLLESKIIHFTNQNESFSKDISNIQTSIININTNLSFFMSETNEKFVDYENALGEIEKNFEVDTVVNEVVVSEYNGEMETVNEEKLENTLQLNHNETNETIETSETIENN